MLPSVKPGTTGQMDFAKIGRLQAGSMTTGHNHFKEVKQCTRN